MQKNIKILIVDDHDLVRTGIKHMLNEVSGLEVVAEAESGEQAINEARSHLPDVVLMDVKMPGIGGLGATRKLLKIKPEIKVLIVTVCDDVIYPTRLLQAGAFGYLTKGASLKEMVKAIYTVQGGKRYISPDVASQMVIKHLSESEQSPLEQLSERELQVTLMIVNGIKVQDIAEKLHLSTKTVNSYRYRIFEKTSVNSDVELTHFSIRHGLIEDVNKDILDIESAH